MIVSNLTKNQCGFLWRLLKKMLTDFDIKQDKEILAIMERIVKVHDIASHENSRCRLLFNRQDAFLLWSIVKTAVDDKVITDPGKVTTCIDIMTVIAVGLDSE